MQALADLLDRLNLVDFVNAYAWSWPLFEIAHFAGMGLVIGTIGLVDLRILGVGKGISIRHIERLIPWGVAGFAVNAATGFVFVAGNPVGGSIEYLTNLAFQIKMVLVLLAGLNLAAFYATGVARGLERVAADGDAAIPAKVVASFSLALWFGVIFFGRLIMYNDTLLYALGL